jgi:hypothetical protein
MREKERRLWWGRSDRWYVARPKEETVEEDVLSL